MIGRSLAFWTSMDISVRVKCTFLLTTAIVFRIEHLWPSDGLFHYFISWSDKSCLEEDFVDLNVEFMSKCLAFIVTKAGGKRRVVKDCG